MTFSLLVIFPYGFFLSHTLVVKKKKEPGFSRRGERWLPSGCVGSFLLASMARPPPEDVDGPDAVLYIRGVRSPAAAVRVHLKHATSERMCADIMTKKDRAGAEDRLLLLCVWTRGVPRADVEACMRCCRNRPLSERFQRVLLFARERGLLYDVAKCVFSAGSPFHVAGLLERLGACSAVTRDLALAVLVDARLAAGGSLQQYEV